MMAAILLSGPEAAVAGALTFCVRCGDPISASQHRCRRCGALGSAPRVKGSVGRSGAIEGKHKDPWVSRYLAGLHDDEETPEADSQDESSKANDNNRLRWSRNAHSLGIGMPSSISRDLRSSQPSTPTGSLSARTAQPSIQQRKGSDALFVPAHLPHDPSSPIIPDASGGLSKVVGSLVEPSASRNKWACSDCQAVFARDSTIYAPPASAAMSDDRFYCKDCYTARYALGFCAQPACGKPVLGSTKETGVYVKAGKSIYHGACFRCFGCDASAPSAKARGPETQTKEILLDLNGHPSCEDCFGKIPKILPKKPHETPSERDKGGSKRRGGGPEMDPTIAELAGRLGVPLTGAPRRARSTSPIKQEEQPVKEDTTGTKAPPPSSTEFQDMRCAHCGRGTFDGPNLVSTAGKAEAEAVIVTLPTQKQVHAACFRCVMCSQLIDPASTFVRAGQDDTNGGELAEWAHPTCAPPSTFDWTARDRGCSEVMTASSTNSLKRSVNSMHPTQQRLPHPSALNSTRETSGGRSPTREPVPIHSFIHRSSPEHKDDELGCTSAPGAKRLPMSTGAVARPERSSMNPSPSVRQFKPSSGAAPPTRSTLNVHRPGGSAGANPARGIFATSQAVPPRTMPPSSGTRSPELCSKQPIAAAQGSLNAPSPTNSCTLGRRYGGMLSCAGCSGRLTSLESVPGPAGSSWHRKCLVCKATKPNAAPRSSGRFSSLSPAPAACGKQLDSFAKVREDGEVRCTSCYREGL